MSIFQSKSAYFFICRFIFFLSSLFLPLYLLAAVPAKWEIQPSESHLTFTGIQNNAPLSGEFTRFSGDIRFDPAQLSASYVKIIVDMNSVTLSFKDMEDALKSPDWLDIKIFPKAVFEAKEFIKLAGDNFQARGSLHIRDKTIPLIVNFDKESLLNNKVKIKGFTVIKRSLFGIGRGEWANTDDIKDDVKINFIITAIKK